MTEKSTITLVYPMNVMGVWPGAAFLLTPAVDAMGTHDIEDIRKAVMAGMAQLWIQYTDKIEAALVTEFKAFPKGLWLNVWLMGAGQEGYNEDAFEWNIFEFAKKNNCIGIMETGRKGWERKHKHLKVNSENVIYNLLISDIIH